jgi:hypothetical protein
MASMDGSFQIVKEQKAKRCRSRCYSSSRLRLSFPVSKSGDVVVELTGIEPVTPCLQSRCSPS